MEITLDSVDKVRERTGVSYAEAKAALENNDGDVIEAIISIEKSVVPEEKTNAIIDKLKKAFKDGNVTNIQMKKDDRVILSIPVNVGVVGGVVGAAVAPWTIILTALAIYGFDCKIELIKSDGSAEDIE